MLYLELFIRNTFNIMLSLNFTPLVLIGLLITSLSLILTLKNTNLYIKKFKEHDNIKLFVTRIFKTATKLIALYIFSIIISYFKLPESTFLELNIIIIIYFIVSLLFLILLFNILLNLFMITFIIKNIVTTALNDTSIWFLILNFKKYLFYNQFYFY